MSSKILGILDSSLISGTFVGGGGINSQEIIIRLAKDFRLIYFPRASVVHHLTEDKKRNLIANIDKLEKLDIEVSSSFKGLINGYNNFDNYSFKKFRNSLIAEYADEIRQLDVLYDNDFAVSIFPSPLFKGEMYYLSKFKGKTKFGITIRGFVDINSNNNMRILLHTFRNEKLNFSPQIKGKYISLLFGPFKQHYISSNLLRGRKLDFIGFINPGISGLLSLKRSGAELYNLFPAEASRFKALNSGTKKRNQAVFFGRLVPEKGIFEIPRIALNLKKMGVDINIKVLGKFTFDHDRHIFSKLVQKLGVADIIDYLGFLPEAELSDVIGNSSLFLNPSHSDAYSIAMLEALSLNVPVVAYDIPFLYNIYKDVTAVKFVKEYDTKAMAREVAEIMSYGNDKINELFDSNTTDFISLHSSYDISADKIKTMINSEL